MRSFGGELEPVLLRLSNKPNELDNEQIELLCVGRPSPSPSPSPSPFPLTDPHPRPDVHLLLSSPPPLFDLLALLAFGLTQT